MLWIILAVAGILLNSGQFGVNQGRLYPPFEAALARRTNKENPDLIADVADLIGQFYKGVIDSDRYYDLMRQIGYDQTTASQIYSGAQNMLTGFDYVTLWRRGEIDDDELSEKLHNVGYSPKSQDHLKTVSLYYPNPQDLVRFAVREVYTPAVVSKYGLNEDFPDEFLTASRKGGLSDDFAKQYWAAHWQLPSAFQGFEMFQREIINDDDLTLLLKSLDVMPYWRTRMKQLQYNVVTRVDVRRLYKTGIYDLNDVYTAYLHMGYKPEDATNLMRFTELEYSPIDEDKQSVSGLVRNAEGNLVPSRTMVMDAYKRGIYDYTKALTALEDIGYPLESGRLLIQFVDDDLNQEIIDIKADAITDAFRAGDFDETGYKSQLTLLGVSSRYIEVIMARELAQAKRRERKPTKADIKAWYTKGLIDAEQYVLKMESLGYQDSDIELYFAEITLAQEQEE